MQGNDAARKFLYDREQVVDENEEGYPL